MGGSEVLLPMLYTALATTAVSSTVGAVVNNQGVQAAKGSANAQSDQIKNANEIAKANQQNLLQSPQNITPDNFMAQKNQQLANLRLGLASTISGTGPSGAQAAVLSRPTLAAGGPGKSKMGN